MHPSRRSGDGLVRYVRRVAAMPFQRHGKVRPPRWPPAARAGPPRERHSSRAKWLLASVLAGVGVFLPVYASLSQNRSLQLSLALVAGVATAAGVFISLLVAIPGGTIRIPGGEAATGYAEYLRAFLGVDRCPAWDPNLCDPQRRELARIHYVVANRSDPPAFTGMLDSITDLPAATRVETIARLVQLLLGGHADALSVSRRLRGLLGRRTGGADSRRRVFVLLGQPASGKSTFAIQAVHNVAEDTQRQGRGWIPVYLNLAHFDADYEATASGFERFATDAISQACPRHLLHRAGPITRLLNTARRLLAGSDGVKTLFVLDSMDEMPTDPDLPARVEAIAAFIDRRHEASFLVTCRPVDFVKLKSYAQNFQVQRLDLLPWTREMVVEHVRSLVPSDKAKQDAVLARVLKSGHGPARSLFHPLEVRLLSQGGHSGISMSGLMDQFIADQFRGQVPDAGIGKAVDALALLAFKQVWPQARTGGQRTPETAEIIRAACAAGLLTQGATTPVFEIRPLLHHLAARDLLRRIRHASGNGLPARIRLEDLNAREVFRALSDQAGCDQRWLRIIRQGLDAPATLRVRGDRLAFAAYAVTDTQLECDEHLRGSLERQVELLAMKGDDVERERALDALERRPALLDPKIPSVTLFFARIITGGSDSALSWLLMLFARDRIIRRRFRRHWWAALGRAMDKGILGRLLLLLLMRRLPHLRIVEPLLYGARYVLLFAGHYGTYVAAWMVASVGLLPLYRLNPNLTSPVYGRLSEVGLAELWRGQFTPDLRFQLGRLLPLIVTFYVPRHYLLQRAKEGLGLSRWWRRYLILAGTTVGLRFGWGVMVVVWQLPVLGVVFRILLVGVVFAVLVAMASGQSSTPAGGSAARPHPTQGPPGLGPTTGSAVLIKGPVPVLLPSDEMALQLATLASGVRTTPRKSALRVWLSGGFVALWLVVIVAGLLRGGVAFALGLAALGLGAAMTYVYLVQPVRHCRQLKREIRRQVREGLTEDLQATFRAVLHEVGVADHPDWIRSIYVDALAEVRFDAALLDELERFYSKNFPDAKHARTKARLTRLILDARHEVQKAGMLNG
jgi:hypothetical protein